MIEIKPNTTYSGRRWKGDRKVVQIAHHRGQDAIVHYVDMRTSRTGNATLKQFSEGVLQVVDEGANQ